MVKCSIRLTITLYIPLEVSFVEVEEILRGCKCRIISKNEDTRRIICSASYGSTCLDVLSIINNKNVNIRVESRISCHLNRPRRECLDILGRGRLKRVPQGIEWIGILEERIHRVLLKSHGIIVWPGRKSLHVPLGPLAPIDLELGLDEIREAVSAGLRTAKSIANCSRGA